MLDTLLVALIISVDTAQVKEFPQKAEVEFKKNDLKENIIKSALNFHNSGKKDGMSVFTGAGVAIITPMKANGEVNYDKLGEFLDYQINNSTDAIIICGTTGEASTLTHEEHVETIRFAADYVKKRVTVIAGTGSNCTETAIMMSKEAASYGAGVTTSNASAP